MTVGAMAAQDGSCGAARRGALLLFDATTRALRRELRAHGGGAEAIAPSNGGAGQRLWGHGGADFAADVGAADGMAAQGYSSHGGAGAPRSSSVCRSGVARRPHRARVGRRSRPRAEHDGCVATLSGHTGSVSALYAHADAVYSGAGEPHRALLGGGGRARAAPLVSVGSAVAALVPMGRQLWAAAQDGAIHALTPATLAGSVRRAPPTRAADGVGKPPARTTRRCWSFSLGDGAVRVWTRNGRPGDE